MRVAGASGNDVSLDTAFQPSNGENRAAVALSIDYSNSPQFFQQEGLASTADQQGLLTVVNGAQNGIFSSWRDKIKRWIDEVRKVDIDSSTAVTKEIAPNPTTLFEATAGGGKCSAGSSLVAQASMKLTAAAKATATGIFGIKVLGTLVPFDLKEAYFYVRMNGSAEISCELDVALLAEAKKRIAFPTVDISPFGIPEVVSLGPQLNFAILGQASLVAQGTIRGAVTIALPEHDVYVGIAGDTSETDQGKAKPPSAPPKIQTTFNESLLINGNVQLSAIPSLDIGIDGLAGAFKATVGVQAQGSLTLVMNSEITREQANLCVNVDAGASISATATLNSKVVSGLGGIAFQSDPVHVYQRCINNSRTDDQGPPVAVSKRSLPHKMNSPFRLQKRQAAGDRFACPPFGIDIPANAPFMTAIDTLGANGYVMLDQCLVDGKPVAPCPGRLGNDVGAPTPPPAGFPVFVGYHGTSAKVAELILTNGPKVLSDKAIDGKNQFGPGFYVTDNIETAQFFAGSTGKLLEVYVEDFRNLRSHIFLQSDGFVWFGAAGVTDEVAEDLVRNYDVIIGPHESGGFPKKVNQYKFNKKTVDAGRVKVVAFDPNRPKPSTYTRPLLNDGNSTNATTSTATAPSVTTSPLSTATQTGTTTTTIPPITPPPPPPCGINPDGTLKAGISDTLNYGPNGGRSVELGEFGEKEFCLVSPNKEHFVKYEFQPSPAFSVVNYNATAGSQVVNEFKVQRVIFGFRSIYFYQEDQSGETLIAKTKDWSERHCFEKPLCVPPPGGACSMPGPCDAEISIKIQDDGNLVAYAPDGITKEIVPIWGSLQQGFDIKQPGVAAATA